MSEEKKNNSDKRDMSDYEYISDLTAIAGQEKASFDSVVNWTLMVNLAGFGFLISKFLSIPHFLCIEQLDLRTVSILLWTISILFFFTVAFAIRAWRSYGNYYEYCRARRDRLEQLGNFQINEPDKRGRSHKSPCFLGVSGQHGVRLSGYMSVRFVLGYSIS